MRQRLGAAVLATLMCASSAAAESKIQQWSDLEGWAEDDHAAARSVLLNTCNQLKGPEWSAVCVLARKADTARDYFERNFTPVMVSDGEGGLFTGYYEPELSGSLTKNDKFKYPIRRRPSEAEGNSPWLSRKDIETANVLNGRELEIAWLSDPVDKFFLQVQGSGRIRMDDGESLRVGYGGKNGHPYRSVGKELVRQGIFESHQVSAGTIRKWVKQHPSKGTKLLWHNPSYVFFREVKNLAEDKGPIGAMNRPVTAGRSIAVDPKFVPLGAPVWIEKNGKLPLRRLMVAQDTGSAIKGAQRGDIFFGSGKEAGKVAGRTKDKGRMVVLLPTDVANTLVND